MVGVAGAGNELVGNDRVGLSSIVEEKTLRSRAHDYLISILRYF
jgi:hypothetical protein